MNDFEKGWLVGIIDGEGSISMDRKGHWRQPRIKVASTDMEILDECIRITGSGACVMKKPRKSNHSISWCWSLSSTNKVIDVLNEIHLYLKCPKKKRRAKFILDNYKLYSRRNGYYTEEEKVLKRQFEEDFYKL